MKINLADLKSNPKLVQELMAGAERNRANEPKAKEGKKKKKRVRTPEERKKAEIKAEAERHFKPAQPAAKNDSPVIVIDEELEEQPIEAPKEVKVRQEGDYLVRATTIAQHVRQAEAFFNQTPIGYRSMEILFSSAYRWASMKMRITLAAARQLCREAMRLSEAKEKAKAKALARGKKLDRAVLKEFSTAHIKEALDAVFITLHEEIQIEDKRREGTAYNDLHKEYAVNLAPFDTSPHAVVMTRANVMVTVDGFVDMAEVKRRTKHIDVIHVESRIYAIRNALMIGFNVSALPSKINEDSLETALASHFRLSAVPIAKQLRHPTSNRMWFYVPEYEFAIRTISFADRSLNSEFEAFKTLSNNPSPDEVRFFFMQAGATNEKISEIMKRWGASDSYQGRINILTSELNTLKRMQKSERLRKLRMDFQVNNEDIIRGRLKAEDEVLQAIEERSRVKTLFSTLASHTGNPKQGLKISQYSHLASSFDKFEAVAVRGNTDSHQRILLRDGIRKDRIRCRILRGEFTELGKQRRDADARIKNLTMMLEHNRLTAFKESSGK